MKDYDHLNFASEVFEVYLSIVESFVKSVPAEVKDYVGEKFFKDVITLLYCFDPQESAFEEEQSRMEQEGFFQFLNQLDDEF